ncbi:hypothetical protein VTL71DRAFT_1172 [Oculimacula yallundae]|uniref:BTB domain-containing protein n=1 Tax=Oculimacula yallundae TaxID=86028 RepID=A0ABR4D2B3_9HELO
MRINLIIRLKDLRTLLSWKVSGSRRLNKSQHPYDRMVSKTTSNALSSESFDDEEAQQTVEIYVGNDKDSKSFNVNKLFLCRASKLFQQKASANAEATKYTIHHITYCTPVTFELLVQWIGNPLPPIGYNPDLLPQEPWLSNAATTWFLGKALECSDDFDKFALSQFIQCCSFMTFGPWKMIELGPSHGSLRRFSDHWIAWNSSLICVEPNEYSGLRAAAKTSLPPERDPRLYDIEHWYSECGKYLRPKCLHDPILRLEKIEEAKRPKPVPPSTWGRSRESRRNLRHNQDIV